MLDLVRRGEKGDESTLPELRELLKSPKMVELCGGDLALLAQQTLIAKAAGKNLPHKEALTRKLELLRVELGGPTPTLVERLLVERIISSWLQLHHFEQIYEQTRENLRLEVDVFYQQSIDRAQKRYLAAIKTLAVVRKLALPVLQVNIARQQVNVAGAETSPGP
jgi:hypothetical protein